MITERLYYTDSTLPRSKPGLSNRRLTRTSPLWCSTAPFSTPPAAAAHDTGTLDGISVVDVSIREPDGAVLHALARPLDGDRVTGMIDWPRRFDHMQHPPASTSSQAFVRVADAATIGFHQPGQRDHRPR